MYIQKSCADKMRMLPQRYSRHLLEVLEVSKVIDIWFEVNDQNNICQSIDLPNTYHDIKHFDTNSLMPRYLFTSNYATDIQQRLLYKEYMHPLNLMKMTVHFI